MVQMLLTCLISYIVGISALSDFVKNNVRENFGNDRFISIHGNEITDVVYEILHTHDKFGHSGGNHHIKVPLSVIDQLNAEGVSFEDETEVFLSNVERNLQDEEFVCQEGAEACAARPSDEFFNTYHTIETLYQRYENLHLANPENTRWEVLGQSYEGRDQMLLWIGDDGKKPLVYYYCAVHAREWIGPLYCAHLAESLLDKENIKAQNLLKAYSFVITPIANPDGYKFTHTVNNFWRKTRRPNEGSDCVGTDPNRNWGYEWGGLGASTNPCSDTYRGAAPFDQDIIRNLKEFSDKHKDRLIHINDVHSYGEYYLSAWAYTTDLPPQEDYIKMEATNQAMFDAIKDFSGLEFKIGPTAETIYPASGGSMDYFYGVNDIIYAGSYEARGGGESGLQGFQPSTENIKPSNAELFEGTYAFLDKIFEIELCRDWVEPNVNGQQSCADLLGLCSDSEVQAQCPASCNTCLLSVVTIEAQQDEDGDTDVTGFAIAVVFVVALLAGALVAYRMNKRNRDVAVLKERETTLHHYTQTL